MLTLGPCWLRLFFACYTLLLVTAFMSLPVADGGAGLLHANMQGMPQVTPYRFEA